ncbi:hypothetical protein [Streptomyces violascens]|uniref:hypothetical protein n=1 Tax=Streptomyces violascens TaxID=67381 RepID=UPI0016755DBD|nr:hypothetical protein [Streptomyces violascens]GGU39059.1 hypothetical protein GCM10010289_69920 [Streptomyces violascens]
MLLSDLPTGILMLTGSVVTAVEARELREGDLLRVSGTQVTVTSPADDHVLTGMRRVSVSFRPYDNDTVRTEGWTLPEAARFTAVQLLRPEHVECALCKPGTNSHVVLVDRVAHGWVQRWVCDSHHQRS